MYILYFIFVIKVIYDYRYVIIHVIGRVSQTVNFVADSSLSEHFYDLKRVDLAGPMKRQSAVLVDQDQSSSHSSKPSNYSNTFSLFTQIFSIFKIFSVLKEAF